MPDFPSRGRAAWPGLLLLAFLASTGAAAAGVQPPPEECTLEPLTLPLFDATPAAEVAATLLAREADSAADPGTIRRAVETIVACINTGDPAYQFAIFTERYLARQFVDPSVTYQPEFERQLALGPSDEAETFELVEVSGFDMLEDGRVSVVVELTGGRTTYRDTLVLANVDGIWLIDAIEEFDPPR